MNQLKFYFGYLDALVLKGFFSFCNVKASGLKRLKMVYKGKCHLFFEIPTYCLELSLKFHG